MIYYNWVGKPITSINEVQNNTKMYHFSSGNDGMYGVPEDDIYVISAGRRGFNAIKLKDVVLDNLGKPTIAGRYVVPKPGFSMEPLEDVFKRTIDKGLPIHEVKSSLDFASAAVPAAVGGRKNKKSHKKSHKKSQKKSQKKNKTSRRHK
jgi:hypothetical protein